MNEIPDSIKHIFAQLKNEITSLHARWKIYSQLFAHSEERTKLLNRSAPTFFVFIHEVLIDHIQLAIGKLTDDPGTGDKQNLSLRMLDEHVKELKIDSLSAKLKDIRVDLFGADPPTNSLKCEAIRKHRNKRIAHFDYNTAISDAIETLPGVSRQMIEDVLFLMRNYMNTIEGYFCQSTYLYEDPMIGPYDTEALISILEDGLLFRGLEVESLEKKYELNNEDQDQN